MGYLPCKLCIYQRIPFLVAIFICFLGYNYIKSDRILIALIITFILSTALAGYHFGIENGIFDEFAGCTNTNIDITNKEKIIEKKLLKFSIVISIVLIVFAFFIYKFFQNFMN